MLAGGICNYTLDFTYRTVVPSIIKHIKAKPKKYFGSGKIGRKFTDGRSVRIFFALNFWRVQYIRYVSWKISNEMLSAKL